MKIMPNCREITEQAQQQREAGLPFWKRIGFHVHLRMCSYCRRYVKNLDLTVAVLNKIGGEERVSKNNDNARIVELLKQHSKENKKP